MTTTDDASLALTGSLPAAANSWARRARPPDIRRRPDIWVMTESGHLNDHFDLDRRAQRQRGDSDRAAGVLPDITEDLTEQLASAVDHLRLGSEIGHRSDEPHHLHDPRDRSQITDLSLDR